MLKTNGRRGLGGLLTVLTLLSYGFSHLVWSRFADPLLLAFAHGLLLAAGCYLMDLIDLDRLGSFSEALAGMVLGVLLLLYGRIWQAGLSLPQGHDETWLPYALPSAMLAAAYLWLLAFRCVQKAVVRELGGFNLQRFAFVAVLVLFACFQREMADALQRISQNQMRTQPYAWLWLLFIMQALSGLFFVLVGKRSPSLGWFLVILGGGYFALQVLSYWLLPGLREFAGLYLGVHFDNIPVYTGLLLLGIWSLPRKATA